MKDFKASELGGIAGKAALAELPKGVEVDQVFFGYVPLFIPNEDRAEGKETLLNQIIRLLSWLDMLGTFRV